jgi:hypothetical protein
MSQKQCSTHKGAVAFYHCEGCRERLCEECVEHGHRLIFCKLCGERALPLDQKLSEVTTPQLEVRRKREQPDYTLLEAFGYPFRGIGAYAFWGLVVLLTAIDLAGVIIVLAPVFCVLIPFLLLIAIAVHLLLLLILPGFLFRIIGDTAKGENELPDWPDWSDLTARLSEVIAFVAVVFVVGLLTGGMLSLAGCHPARALMGGLGTGCWLALMVAFVLSLAVGLPALGAVGTFRSPALVLRVDRHVRAMLGGGSELWTTVGLVAALFFVGRLLRNTVPDVPVVGTFFFILIGGYALFTGAHLTGLLFRFRYDEMEAIYFPEKSEG